MNPCLGMIKAGKKSFLTQLTLLGNSLLISCFLNGGYSYNPSIDIEVQTVIDFYSLVTSLPPSKRKILFDNIYTRLSTIQVENDDEELPF